MNWSFKAWIGGNKLPSRDEVVISALIDKYLKLDVKKLILPILNKNIFQEDSNEYIFEDEKRNISILIGDGYITISNHDFYYNKNFNINFTDKLKKKIRIKIEEERQELKKVLFKNEVDLLQKIKDL